MNKQEIGLAICAEMDERNLSLRKVAEMSGNIMHHQIHRITNGKLNYNIDTLMKVLDTLDLEIVIKSKNG